ncbi:MAG: succinylglutamate desuccinylase/aspartoacylase family protein [Myxococcota bacterium]
MSTFAPGTAPAKVVVTRTYRQVAGVALFEAVGADGSRIPGERVAIVANTHGNEPVGERVFERLEPLLSEQLVRGSVLLVRSNQVAAAQNRRHTADGEDINRLWDAQSLRRLAAMPPAERCYEHRRVLELAPLLTSVDAILDLHSASQPSPPFLVVRDDQQHAAMVQRLGVQRVVTGLHEAGVLGGGVCPDVGLHLGEHSSRLGMTFEAGQHSDPENRKRAFEVVVRLLDAMGVWGAPPPPTTVRPQVYEVIDAFRQAPHGAEPFQFPGYLAGTHELMSGRPLASFQPVQAGEVLLRRGEHTVIRASSPFTLLLPTPTADPGTDLYYTALERISEASQDRERSPDQARREAAAVEAMLDLLGDDEIARGATWASFDRRQVLDLACEAVLRTLRLPEGDPHRRITLVGRGDWGGGSSEVRAGRRYRQAFRRALSEGVPIDRYQLLQGASLGWLDALTSDSMALLLEKRRAKRQNQGQRGAGIRLFLSAQRPSTVALLVTGDLDRAEADGDFRHVRVVVIIEAPSVEPDVASASVQVLRFGLVSARPAFLHLARALLGRLRMEHAALVRQAPLGDDPVMHDLLGEADAIVPPADRTHLQALGHSLRDLQLRLWRDSLKHLVEPRGFDEPSDIGRWLASLMQRSGVLDAEGLRDILLVDDHVVPARLEDPAPHVKPHPPLHRTHIRPPLSSRDVTGDTYSRWVGWRRFLAQRQVIPHTRGEDVDLVLSERALAERLASWLRAAGERANEQPGRVMVVLVGDGLRPGEGGAANPLLEQHQALLLNTNVRYLRIQHARGSYLRWLKGLVYALRARGDGAAPAAIRLKGDSSASVNLVLIATIDDEPSEDLTLDGWTLHQCAALVSSLGERGSNRLGLFTESQGSVPANAELLQFARAHCESLLGHGSASVRPGDADGIESQFIDQLAHWIDRARDLQHAPFPVPDVGEDRAGWLSARLGLADPSLVRAVVHEMAADEPSAAVAWALWDSVVPWPRP